MNNLLLAAVLLRPSYTHTHAFFMWLLVTLHIGAEQRWWLLLYKTKTLECVICAIQLQAEMHTVYLRDEEKCVWAE